MHKKYRKYIERLYMDKANIYEYQSIEDEETGETIPDQPVLAYEAVPCRLSSESITPAIANEINNTSAIKVKLFTKPEYIIKPGSKIEVTQSHGRVSIFKSANGKSFVYSSHQEIVLEEVEEI